MEDLLWLVLRLIGKKIPLSSAARTPTLFKGGSFQKGNKNAQADNIPLDRRSF